LLRASSEDRSRCRPKLAPSIASILRKRIPDLEPTALDRFVFAAQVAEQLSNGQLDQQGAATAKGELLAYRWRERAVACFATEFARVAIERSLPAPGPDLSVSLANSGEHDSTFRVHASWQSPLLSAPLQIVSHTDLPSERLASLARLLLWAAALGFVLGNFWLLQLVRRELRITRLKQDFVDLVSHELRTPLTAVSLKSEMLARGDVPIERQPDYARTLYGDVRRLAELVERILDFARLSKGRMPLSKCPTPARELLARALVAGRPALQMAAQRVQVHAERKLPTVEVDVEVLARALRNLLENAAKYAPSGSTVHVTASHEEDQLVIRIRDEGAELDRNELRTIFEPFRRGGAAGAKPGTGLGLAVVAQSVRAHGGQVSASLAHEGGAEFVVSIPIREDVA
jgi:signal transduction histidine kinase